jgi:hypothetical protein
MPVPVTYKGALLRLGFRADILLADAVIFAIKAVAAFGP